MFIKYEELDKLEKDQFRCNDDVNNNNIILGKTVKSDVRFADDQPFGRTVREDIDKTNFERTIPTLRASAAAKAKAAAAVPSNFQGFQGKPSNEKQTDLMYFFFFVLY